MKEVRDYFDNIAEDYHRYKKKNSYYNNQLKSFYKQIIPEGSRVLEIGCATGDLLAYVNPSYGLGIDISTKMLEYANKAYPWLNFKAGDIDSLAITDNFDFIILSNLLDYVDDIYLFFVSLKKIMTEDTKVIINTYNPLWAPLIHIAAKLYLRTDEPSRNFITLQDVCNMLTILNFDISEKGFRMFVPFNVPLFSYVINKLLPRLHFINNFSLAQYVICRKKQVITKRDFLSCTVVVPCHNEDENIEECIRRVPNVGKFTEIKVIDDGSADNTFNVAKAVSERDHRVKVISLDKNYGKGYAVKMGFDAAEGDVLIILDADMAVPPEEITKFFNTIADGSAEFVNGTRMIYPREKGSMKFTNFLGNKIFGIITSIIISQRNTDTLCGTKALLRKHYRYIEMKSCKWGDFDLLFGAAKLKLKMVEMPVHYKKRIKGFSKMKAIRYGFAMLARFFVMLWKLE